MVLKKLEHFGFRGLTKQWFAINLINWKQDVVIGKHVSTTKRFLRVTSRESVLGLLIFLKYIVDLNKSIKYSQIYHFACDASSSIKLLTTKTR